MRHMVSMSSLENQEMKKRIMKTLTVKFQMMKIWRKEKKPEMMLPSDQKM